MSNYQKAIVKYALFQGISFMIILTLIRYWVNDDGMTTALTFGIVTGFFVGLMNGLLFYKFAVPKYKLEAISVDLESHEVLEFQTPAKFTSNQEPAMGKLFLTNTRLIFRDHISGKNAVELSIDLKEIAKIETSKKGRLFENGLTIHTYSNVKYEFVVDKIKQWVIELGKNDNGLQQVQVGPDASTINIFTKPGIGSGWKRSHHQ